MCSAAVLYFSRNGLRERHSYGYYRFFALEFVLLLIVANLRMWFVHPFSLLGILSWVSLVVAFYFAVYGARLARQIRLMPAADQPVLIESGLCSEIRHPLYSALLFLGLSSFLKAPGLFPAILLFGAGFTLVSTAKAEEELEERKFGQRYRGYRERTKMFVPYLF